MIGLPVGTAEAGFIPSLIGFLAAWIVMTSTALLMLEVSLHIPGQTNLISMAQATLGPWGARIAWFVYLFFMYAVMASYTAGGGALFADALNFPVAPTTLAFVVLFGTLIYIGTQAVDWCNRVFMFALIGSFFLLLGYVAPLLEPQQWVASQNPTALWSAMPLLVAAFGFHLLVPSLSTYFHYDRRRLIKVVFIGATIPLVVYIVWEAFILGALNPQALKQIAHEGDAVTGITHALQSTLPNSPFSLLAQSFSFFALVSSLIGVALGVFDFLADGLSIEQTGKRRLLLIVLTFLPPYLFSYFYPEGFLMALSYAGVCGAILLILYPTLMVWSLRRQGYTPIIPATTPAFVVLTLVGASVVVLHLLARWGYLPSAL